VNERFKRALDELASALFGPFCEAILEADVVAHLYHVWHKIGATRIGWPHVSVRLPGLRPRESVDLAIGSVSKVRGRRTLEPIITAEVKVLFEDFSPQQVSRRVKEMRERDLPKLARVSGPRNPERYLIVVDEWGRFLPDRTTGERPYLTALLAHRDAVSPGVQVILFEKGDARMVWSLH